MKSKKWYSDSKIKKKLQKALKISLKPEFTDIFESGLINAGDYINGELVDSAVNTSDLDASTYNPDTAQDTVVDAGLYINVES